MTVYVNVEVPIDLDDIDTEDLIEELATRGAEAIPNGIDMQRLRHLFDCGLLEQAQSESWQMIKKILRQVT